MNILIDIGHPGHVHLFRNFASIMKGKGHDIYFTSRNKECTLDLLKSTNLPYESVGKPFKGALKKFLGMPKFSWQIYKIAKQRKIDIFLSMSSMYAAQASFLLGKPAIAYDDTEHSTFEYWLYAPLSKSILTPVCFLNDYGKKQIRYKGFHELHYLHPNYFKPDDSIYKFLGINKNERYCLLRFVSWNAGHDIQAKGLTLETKIKLAEELSKRLKVFISSEGDMPEHLKKYQIRIPPERIHDALAFADLYVGEGATMASECAMLGTPAIYVNSLDAGTLQEQTNYGLLYSFRDSKGVLEKALELIDTPDLKAEFQKRRQKMLSEKIDPTAFMVWFIENYPKSAAIVKANPAEMDKFR